MPAGRPTKYDDKILQRARKYLVDGWVENGEVVPTVAGLAVYCKIARETIYAWAAEEDKQEFSDIVEELMSSQEMKLVAGGLSNVFNATITKLALSKHNYSDKSETTLQGAGGGPVQVIYEAVSSDGRRSTD